MAMKENRIDRAFDICNYTILSILLVLVLYPILYVVSSSFSSGTAILSGKVWLFPVDVTLEGYTAVFRDQKVLTGFANSFFYMFAGTLISLVLTIMAAYPLSRKDMPAKNAIIFIFAFTMMFSGGIIPKYLLMRDLHLIYTRWVMIIPGALSVWNTIMMRTYFQSNIPDELLWAAEMDGCSDFRFLISVILPLSPPILAVCALFHAIGEWNSFFDALLYLRDRSMYPIQILLRDILMANTFEGDMLADANVQSEEGAAEREALRYVLKYSLIVVANIPLIVIYPFAQKYFVKGVMVGAIKG